MLLLSNNSQESEAVDSEVEPATLTFKKSVITVELEKALKILHTLNDMFFSNNNFRVHFTYVTTQNQGCRIVIRQPVLCFFRIISSFLRPCSAGFL